MPSRCFPPDLAASATARKFVRECLDGCETGEIEVVVSELVTNVAKHAKTELLLTVELGHGIVRIEVEDGSSVLPAVREIAAAESGGWGLRLIQSLTLDWGVELTHHGKRVWAELPLVPDSSDRP